MAGLPASQAAENEPLRVCQTLVKSSKNSSNKHRPRLTPERLRLHAPRVVHVDPRLRDDVELAVDQVPESKDTNE